MDQKFIAGIGNVYSDEILFEAGIRVGGAPERLVDATRGPASLTRDQRDAAGGREIPRVVARRRG
jgi:formamidopyrimidine-DNA glycosylase